MNKAKKVRLLLTACQLDNETWINRRRWGFLLPHVWKQWVDHAQWKGFPKFIECLTDESIKEGNVWWQTTNEIHKCKSNWGVFVLQGVEILELLLNPLVEWIVVFIPINHFVGQFKWELSIFFFVFALGNWFYGFVTTIYLSLCPIDLRSLGSFLFVIYHTQFSLCIVLPGFVWWAVWVLCCSVVVIASIAIILQVEAYHF